MEWVCNDLHVKQWGVSTLPMPNLNGGYIIIFINKIKELNFDLIYIHLTHWGRVTHICAGNLTIIGPDNGLSPGPRQAIIWNNAGILSIGPLGTNFSDILIEILTFSFRKMWLKVSSAKWRPFCLGLNVLIYDGDINKCQLINHINPSLYCSHSNTTSTSCLCFEYDFLVFISKCHLPIRQYWFKWW